MTDDIRVVEKTMTVCWKCGGVVGERRELFVGGRGRCDRQGKAVFWKDKDVLERE